MDLISKILGIAKKSEQKADTVSISPARSEKSDSDRYFALLGAIQDWQAKKQYDRMLRCCAESLPLLPSLVRDWKREYGAFEISSIPAIEVGCRYWAALNDITALASVESTIAKVPELMEGWAEFVKASYEDAKLARRILDYIRTHHGALQNQMGKLLNVSGKDTARIINTLTNLGKIVRVKSGKTYQLRVSV